jgi:hypothetical protein
VVFTYAKEKPNQIAAEEYVACLGKSATAIAIDMSDPTSIRWLQVTCACEGGWNIALSVAR